MQESPFVPPIRVQGERQSAILDCLLPCRFHLIRSWSRVHQWCTPGHSSRRTDAAEPNRANSKIVSRQSNATDWHSTLSVPGSCLRHDDSLICCIAPVGRIPNMNGMDWIHIGHMRFLLTFLVAKRRNLMRILQTLKRLIQLTDHGSTFASLRFSAYFLHSFSIHSVSVAGKIPS